MLTGDQLRQYERKGPAWWAEHRGFCAHCGEPTMGGTLCARCAALGHYDTMNPDAMPCPAAGCPLGDGQGGA